MSDPVCVKCKAVSSVLWHRGEDGSVVCHNCLPPDIEKCNSETSSSQLSGHCQGIGGSTFKAKPKEKATKVKQGKGTSKNGGGTQQSAGRSQQKGRRTLVKQKPVRAPKDENSACSVVTSDSITYKGVAYEIGDVVSILDRGGGIYFALVRGFLQNCYAEKFAVLTWLIPTRPNPKSFDPSRFVLGPEEDNPWSLEYLEFVCHSPQSRHFQASFLHNLEQAELWSSRQPFTGQVR